MYISLMTKKSIRKYTFFNLKQPAVSEAATYAELAARLFDASDDPLVVSAAIIFDMPCCFCSNMLNNFY